MALGAGTSLSVFLLAAFAPALVAALAPAAGAALRPRPASLAAPRLRAPIASAEPYDDEYYDEEDEGADELESLPVDWDATLAWQRFKLSSALALQPILEDKTPRFGQIAGSAAGTIFFLFILHTCARTIAAPALSLPRFLSACTYRSLPPRMPPASPPSLGLRARCSDLLHAGGGLVIVPEGDFVCIYNFQELKNMENAHLVRLGLPMPALPAPALFRWSFLTAGVPLP